MHFLNGIASALPQHVRDFNHKEWECKFKLKVITAMAGIAIASMVPAAVSIALLSIKFTVFSAVLAASISIPILAVGLIGLSALGYIIYKHEHKSSKPLDKFDYFVKEAKRLNLDKTEIEKLKKGLNNIRQRHPVHDIVDHGISPEEAYAPQEKHLDQLFAKFITATPEKDLAKIGALRILIHSYDDCFPRQSVASRYAVLAFDEPANLQDKIPYFVRRFKEEAIQKMVDDQEKINQDDLRSPITQRAGESFEAYRQRTARVPACIKDWPTHDANKICLIIDLIGKDIGIPTEYSDKKILEKSYYASLVNEKAKQEILKSYMQYYGSEGQLTEYLKTTLNEPVRKDLLQECISSLIKSIYQNQDQHSDLLSGFIPSQDHNSDIELLKYIEDKVTEKDSEGKFKITDAGIKYLLLQFP